MKKLYKVMAVLVVVVVSVVVFQNKTQSAAVTPAQFGLQEGNTVSASGSADPDIYIINSYGYKRLFLNPDIFKMYGHLRGFGAVKTISADTRDAFTTTTLFTNCESKDGVVYAVEVVGEDAGILHPLAISKQTALYQDPNFEKKTFCINNREFNWYPKGSTYTSLSQIPVYFRAGYIDPVVSGMLLQAQQRLFPYKIFSTETIRSSSVRFAGNWSDFSTGDSADFSFVLEGSSNTTNRNGVGRVSLERFRATQTGQAPINLGPLNINYRILGNIVYIQPTALVGLNLAQYEQKWYQLDLNTLVNDVALGYDVTQGANADATRQALVKFFHDEFVKPGAQQILATYPLLTPRADHGNDVVYGQNTRHVTVSINKTNLEATLHAFGDYVVRDNVHGRLIDVLKNAGLLVGYTDLEIADMREITPAELADYHTEVRNSFISGDFDSMSNFMFDLWIATNDYDIEKAYFAIPLNGVFGLDGTLALTISSFPAQDVSSVTAPSPFELYKTAFEAAFKAELQRVIGY